MALGQRPPLSSFCSRPKIKTNVHHIYRQEITPPVAAITSSSSADQLRQHTASTTSPCANITSSSSVDQLRRHDDIVLTLPAGIVTSVDSEPSLGYVSRSDSSMRAPPLPAAKTSSTDSYRNDSSSQDSLFSPPSFDDITMSPVTESPVELMSARIVKLSPTPSDSPPPLPCRNQNRVKSQRPLLTKHPSQTQCTPDITAVTQGTPTSPAPDITHTGKPLPQWPPNLQNYSPYPDSQRPPGNSQCPLSDPQRAPSEPLSRVQEIIKTLQTEAYKHPSPGLRRSNVALLPGINLQDLDLSPPHSNAPPPPSTVPTSTIAGSPSSSIAANTGRPNCFTSVKGIIPKSHK